MTGKIIGKRSKGRLRPRMANFYGTCVSNKKNVGLILLALRVSKFDDLFLDSERSDRFTMVYIFFILFIICTRFRIVDVLGTSRSKEVFCRIFDLNMYFQEVIFRSVLSSKSYKRKVAIKQQKIPVILQVSAIFRCNSYS